ncbi:MAG: iron-sulfur cluster carrier protein ApbC [Armatimonadota bacterium]|nr:iron-sulfur cluster carrier protein ApbC [Armatimonadota bacterium]
MRRRLERLWIITEKENRTVVTRDEVLKALGTVQDPELRRDLVSAGMIDDVQITDGRVQFELILTTPACPLRAQLRDAAKAAVEQISGVKEVAVKVGSRVTSHRAQEQEDVLPQVSNVIAVASGKGGVGKSTVAVNLAVALAEFGAKVGLLDADIYGPTIPAMMGVNERPKMMDGKIVPIEQHGVKLMSLGFMLNGSPVIWRGPMVAGAVKQMLTDVNWGELDYLIVDLPPGTGDAQLTLAQVVPLTGVVVVTTSQDVALNIASNAASMFSKMNVPILGIVENMSFFICPGCGYRTDIFSHGGGDKAAQITGAPLLGRLPLEPETVEDGDAGSPTVAGRPESEQAEAFRTLASRIAARVSSLDQEECPVLIERGGV